MAGASFYSIDEGTTRKLATWQRAIASNTVEQHEMVLAPAYLPTYVVTATAISTATANSHLLQVMAGPLNRYEMVALDITQVANAGSSAKMRVHVVRLSTAGTGGSSVTPAPLDPADAATAATAMTLPTGKGTEGNFLHRATMDMLATAATAGNNGLHWVKPDPTGKGWIVAAGESNGLAIKNIDAVASGTVDITATFVERFWT